MVVIRIAVSYTIFSEAREMRNIVYSENSFTSGIPLFQEYSIESSSIIPAILFIRNQNLGVSGLTPHFVIAIKLADGGIAS